MEDRKQFEEVYVGLRSGLRMFRKDLDMYLSVERPKVHDGFTSADVRSLREMRKLVNRAVGVLDSYEDMAEYFDEMEKQHEWLWDLTRRVGKHEE